MKIRSLTPEQLRKIAQKIEEMRSVPARRSVVINEKLFTLFVTLQTFGIVTPEEYAALDEARRVAFLRYSTKIGEILQSYGEEDGDG